MEAKSLNDRNTLSKALKSILTEYADKAVSLGELRTKVADKGFGLLLMILSLPSALPIPAPGYSTPFGIAIILIGFQLIMRRKSIWLPLRIARVQLRPSLSNKMLGTALKFLSRTEKWIKPRRKWITTSIGHTALALIVCIMAGLMILPIPLTNTFPAMVIFLIGIGLAEEDGLLALFAFAIGLCAIALYGFIIYLLITEGPDAVDSIKIGIRDLVGLTK
jgi:hypothetical protein